MSLFWQGICYALYLTALGQCAGVIMLCRRIVAVPATELAIPRDRLAHCWWPLPMLFIIKHIWEVTWSNCDYFVDNNFYTSILSIQKGHFCRVGWLVLYIRGPSWWKCPVFPWLYPSFTQDFGEGIDDLTPLLPRIVKSGIIIKRLNRFSVTQENKVGAIKQQKISHK